MQSHLSPDGGIGRRAGLKHQWGNPSRFDPGSGYKARVSHEILAFTFYMALGVDAANVFIIFCVSEVGAYPHKKSSIICAKTGKYLFNLRNQNHISDNPNEVLTTR